MPDQPGFYGKVPQLGDFVTRRLPRAFVEAWDGWLQSAMAASREQLGPGWLDHYLVSPIWRFALAPGLCSEQAWAGIMMPSVDRVGRYFPLTLAGPVRDPLFLPFLFESQCGWFERLERLALTGLEDDFDLERFDAQLLELTVPDWPVPCQPAADADLQQARRGRFALRLGLPSPEQTARGFLGLSACLLRDFLPVHSLWGTAGSERIGPSLLLCAGLPPVDAYASLISGQWRQHGWALHTLPAFAPRSGPDTSPSPVDESGTGLRAETGALDWRSHGISVVGKRRKINEDALLDLPAEGLWVVADGMGGHQAGEVASQAIVKALAELRSRSSLEELVSEVRSRLDEVNRSLFEMAAASATGQIIGSTVVVLLARGNRFAYLWAGDSRLYRLREGRFEQLTRDHSAAGESQWLWEQASGAHCNIITRAVGADAVLELDAGFGEVHPGDRFLLNSDGLEKELNADEIAAQLAAGDCRVSADALIDAALARGARDNVTVVIVEAGA